MSGIGADLLAKQDPASRDGQVSVTWADNVAIVRMQCGQNRLNINFVTKLLNALDEVER